ncbi:MAG: DUF1553 domain-containing protein [Planctomycetes bacterium]|nr:DUF1553 domain-containing protein [Planctomycetota bacterium]
MCGARIAAAAAGLALCVGASRAAAQERAAPSWSREVAPILAARCFVCHGPDPESRKAGLRLDRREDALRAEEGLDPAVAPGDPERSALMQRVLSDDPQERMPPSKGHEPLSAGEIDVLRRWIAAGAVYERHWSWTKLEEVALPPSVGWAWRASDRFVEASLASEGIEPAGDCEGVTWLRRASFALRGLPPREEWLARILERDDAQTRERTVDEMLADRAYAEHWARHWLDVMRYAETRGHEFDYAIREAWRWRDWVVRALREDLPYERFVMEQVAGDLLAPRIDPATGCDEAQVATGWWWLMQASHAPVDARLDEAERIDNQIDVLGKAFLGTTVSCARCHDHKFDDVSQRDYTALFGVARSTRRVYAWQDAYALAAAALAEAGTVREGLRAALGPSEEMRASASGAPPNALWRFDGEGFEGWRASGGAFGARPIAAGELLAVDGAGVTRVEVSAASSRALLTRARGALRSPTFTIESGDLWLRVRGAGAYIRAHVDGYFMREEIELLFESHKQELDHALEWRTRHIDVSRYVGEECWLEVVDPGDGFAELAWVASGSLDEAWKGAASVNEVARAEPAEDSTRAALARLTELASTFPPQPVVLACEDGSGRDAPLYARGRPAAALERVPRGEPQELGKLRREYAGRAAVEAQAVSASRRLELAQELVDPAHPLTWRVAANRVWQHVMGAGLVATPDDFGVLGSPPTHPQLLDWLACRLREHRSFKLLAKELVLSRTFAQRNAPASAQAAELDPLGARLSRRPVRRLSAESVRDSLLAAAGRLVERDGGPSVAARLTDFMQGRGRPESSGPQDGALVRSLYLEVRRNFPDPLLSAFDLPTPSSPRGARSVSNVPAQRLALMNDPFVRELAGDFAAWIARLDGAVQARAAQAMRRLWSRPATAAELALASEFLGQSPDAETWHDWAHALFLAQETIYLP